VNNSLNIRFSRESDIDIIIDFIKSLAKYTKLSDEVVVTEDLLKENIFQNKYAEVLIAEIDAVPIGFAIFYHNFSTFLGKPGIYLEDLFIKPEYRGNGYGKQILTYLAKLAVERDCGRLEWSVLDWDERAKRFYKSLGALSIEGRKTYRLTGSSLTSLANNQ
jgi:GNAT superfamily N-acetyltransferase